MIRAKEYNYYLYGDNDAYGQPKLSEEVKGTVKIAIYDNIKAVQDSPDYISDEYIGLTYDKAINDKYVIQYGDKKLKVLYTISAPSVKTQVFLKGI